MKPAIEHLNDFCAFLAEQHPGALRRLAAMIAATPDSTTDQTYLVPLRILCQRTLAEQREPSSNATDNDTDVLKQRLGRCEQDLSRALGLLAEYAALQQQTASRTATTTPAAMPDFYSSRLYRYVARPIWAITGGIRRLPGAGRARAIIMPALRRLRRPRRPRH